MTKRSSSRRKSSQSPRQVVLGLLALVAAVVVIGFVFGWDAAGQYLGEALGLDIGAPVSREVTSGTGTFTVYFTDPVIPFDDVTEGGIETHLIDLINSAQSSIDVAVFEFNLQNVADALIAAHNRGVAVRMVYDDEHTEDDPQMEEVIAAGIPATPDQRGAFMHNKFFVFDRQLVWTGSWNVTINGSYRNNNNAIVIRSSKLAQNYTAEFEEMFSGEFGPSSPANTPNPVFTLNDIQIENYFAPEDNVTPHIVDAIRSATSTIHFMAFAFTDDDVGGAMLDRLQSGVSVAGIFEVRGADTEFSECGALLAAGADVRLDGNPRTFHHKVIIVDGRLLIVGSFNFSQNATTSNDENLLIIHDPGIAGLYEEEFNRRIAEAQTPVGGVCQTD